MFVLVCAHLCYYCVRGSLRYLFGVFSAVPAIYADGTFNSIVRDADDLGSDEYNSMLSQSSITEF